MPHQETFQIQLTQKNPKKTEENSKKKNLQNDFSFVTKRRSPLNLGFTFGTWRSFEPFTEKLDLALRRRPNQPASIQPRPDLASGLPEKLSAALSHYSSESERFDLSSWVYSQRNWLSSDFVFPIGQTNRNFLQQFLWQNATLWLSMKLKSWWIVLLCASVSRASFCPDSCTCANDGAIVDCSKQGLTRIPSNLPRNTITL